MRQQLAIKFLISLGVLSGTILMGGMTMAANPTTAQLESVHPAMRQVLQRGSTGHWVCTLQADLKELGYSSVGPMDGIFGPKTESAVKAFEQQHGFQPTGVTSPVVWQDILAGFHLVPPVASTQGPASVPSTTLTDPTTTSPAGVAKTIDGRPVLKVIHMKATAYGPSLKDNYPYGPVDAFGQPLRTGMVAVDPSVIPLKSHVYVTGYTDKNLPTGGFLGQAMDTGGAIKGNRIDIFVNSGPQTVSNFGIEPVTVYVLGN